MKIIERLTRGMRECWSWASTVFSNLKNAWLAVDEDEKIHARRMRVARFRVRIMVLITLLLGGGFALHKFIVSASGAERPAVCVVTTEELLLDEDEVMSSNVDTNGTSIDEPRSNSWIVKSESSWVQFAHTALVLSTQCAVLAFLLWGIVAVVRQED